MNLKNDGGISLVSAFNNYNGLRRVDQLLHSTCMVDKARLKGPFTPGM